jgi:hypothetical protein
MANICNLFQQLNYQVQQEKDLTGEVGQFAFIVFSYLQFIYPAFPPGNSQGNASICGTPGAS